MQTNLKKRIRINILTKQGFQDIIPPFKDGEIQFEKLEKKQKPESANCFKKQSEQQIPLENLNQQCILQDSQMYQRDELKTNYNEMNNQEQRKELLQNIKTTLGPDKLKDFQRIKELVEQKSFFKKPSKHLSKLMKEMGLNQRVLKLRQLQYDCFLEVRRKQIVSKQKECRDKEKQNYMYFCQGMLALYAAIEKNFLISKKLLSQSVPQTLDPAANAVNPLQEKSIFQCPDIDFDF